MGVTPAQYDRLTERDVRIWHAIIQASIKKSKKPPE
jgi:hypothetical protein